MELGVEERECVARRVEPQQLRRTRARSACGVQARARGEERAQLARAVRRAEEARLLGVPVDEAGSGAAPER